MSVQREILLATRETGEQARFLLEVFNEHWTSTLARLDARGEPEPTRVAPRFYGLTAEQARSGLEPAGKIPCARSPLCEGSCAVEPAKVLAQMGRGRGAGSALDRAEDRGVLGRDAEPHLRRRARAQRFVEAQADGVRDR